MPTTEKEFQAWFKALDRVAGPDDPIYSSGLTVTSVRRPKEPMEAEQQRAELVADLKASGLDDEAVENMLSLIAEMDRPLPL